MASVSSIKRIPKTEIKTFILFCNDTIGYALEKTGLEFVDDLNEHDDFNSVPIRFSIPFGNAVLCCRNRHRTEFTDLISNYPYCVFKDIHTLTEFMKFSIPKVIRDDVFLMDILRLFAFFSDLAIKCYTSGSEFLICSVVENIELIYIPWIRKVFKTVGGYHSLSRLAKQYLEYHELEFQDDIDQPKDIVGNTSFLLKETNFESRCKFLSNLLDNKPATSKEYTNRPTIVLNHPHEWYNQIEKYSNMETKKSYQYVSNSSCRKRESHKF